MDRIILGKVCSQCKELFPATTDFFYTDKRSSYGLFGPCKPCARQIAREDRKRIPAERKVWRSMRERCTPSEAARQRYPRYAGRGITVCDRWSRYENFFADMGPRPSKNHSLDRIDNDGNYEPDNVRWATQREQMNNTSHCRLLTYKDETLTAAQWARRIGLARGVFYARLRLGWSIEKAIETPLQLGEHVRRGIKNPAAKLTETQVTQIRQQYAQGVSGVYLAKCFGVSKYAVSNIVLGKSWTHI